jgi:hypothetical protein
MLAGDVLRNGYFSIVIVASNNLRRIGTQFIFTKRPEEEHNSID